MGYVYEDEMKTIGGVVDERFRYCGLQTFLATRDRARDLLRTHGCFEAQQAMQGTSGSAWTMLAALDWMVEHGEVIETTPEGRWAQHRLFAAVRQ